MKEKILYRKRKFLNKPSHLKGAFILAEISKSIYEGKIDKKTGEKRKDNVFHHFTFEVADCNRIINLEFDIRTKGDYENSCKKLDILENTIKEFRIILEKEYKEKIKFQKQGIADYD